MTEHPSYLALDRWALGGEDAATGRHVATCERCRAHVGEVRADPGVAPAALRASPRARRSPYLGVSLLAAAAALAFFAWPDAPYVGVKGAPDVEVWTRRGDEVARWEGERLAPGDGLRLVVADAGWVEVRADGELLWRGQHAGGPLPVSWALDGAAPRRLVVTAAPAEGAPATWTHTIDLEAP